MYCESKGVFHRDIKDENILLDTKTGKVKLFDFGSGTILENTLYTDYEGLLNSSTKWTQLRSRDHFVVVVVTILLFSFLWPIFFFFFVTILFFSFLLWPFLFLFVTILLFVVVVVVVVTIPFFYFLMIFILFFCDCTQKQTLFEISNSRSRYFQTVCYTYLPFSLWLFCSQQERLFIIFSVYYG